MTWGVSHSHLPQGREGERGGGGDVYIKKGWTTEATSPGGPGVDESRLVGFFTRFGSVWITTGDVSARVRILTNPSQSHRESFRHKCTEILTGGSENTTAAACISDICVQTDPQTNYDTKLQTITSTVLKNNQTGVGFSDSYRLK